MYETGWNKQLTYVFSFSRHGVVDATARYTRKLASILHSRGPPRESDLQTLVSQLDAKAERQFLSQLASSRRGQPSKRRSSSTFLQLDALAVGALAFEELAAQDISEMTISRRKRLLMKELAGLALLVEHEWKLEELQGRLSGDREWRRQRGELGVVNEAVGELSASTLDNSAGGGPISLEVEGM